MDIRERVLEIRTSRNKQKFVRFFIDTPSEIPKLFKLIVDLEPYPYKEYASWILVHLIKSEQKDFGYLYNDLVDLTFRTDNQSILRNAVNCLNELSITDYRESEFIDLLIGFIQDHEAKVALHVYSIYILIQFCQKYPELSSEIKEVIELNREGKTAAFSVARRNFMKSIGEK